MLDNGIASACARPKSTVKIHIPRKWRVSRPAVFPAAPPKSTVDQNHNKTTNQFILILSKSVLKKKLKDQEFKYKSSKGGGLSLFSVCRGISLARFAATGRRAEAVSDLIDE